MRPPAPTVPLVGGAYSAYSKSQNEQKCINWYPELVPDGENNRSFVLYPTPGMRSYAAPTGTPRGSDVMGGVPYVVFETTLYSVAEDGTLTAISGTVGGSGRVSMSNDGTNLTISTSGPSYTYNGTTLAQITDADFVRVKHNAYQKSFTLYAGGNGQQFQISASLNPGNIDALDFASAEADPDDIKTLEVCNELVYFFGAESTEIWQNTGGIFPFTPITGAYIERGCVAEWSVAKLDGQLFWLADDLNVYRIQGYERYGITPPGISEKIRSAENPQNAYGMAYIQNGHAFYVLTFEEFTLVYDITTQQWHERSTWEENAHTRWNVTHIYSAYNKIYALHEDGNIYQLDPDYFYEGASGMIVRDRISEDIYSNGKRIVNSRLEIAFQDGVGLPDNTIPYAMLRWSDDGGFTYSNEHWSSIGRTGEYRNRAIWNRLGSFYNRRYWLRVSAPVKACVLDAWGEFA